MTYFCFSKAHFKPEADTNPADEAILDSLVFKETSEVPGKYEVPKADKVKLRRSLS